MFTQFERLKAPFGESDSNIFQRGEVFDWWGGGENKKMIKNRHVYRLYGF